MFTAASSYDEVPYQSDPLIETHPDSLATAATLLGMTPAPVDQCRVLELGCAVGGNLIPMAAAQPESQFLGIDISSRQVAAGQALINATGLGKIKLECADILDLDESIGQFDYIICHGVYNWVPRPAQRKILQTCRAA